MCMFRSTIVTVLVFSTLLVNAQEAYWSKIANTSNEQSNTTRNLDTNALYQLQTEQLQALLPNNDQEHKNTISLPSPNKGESTFYVWDAPIIQPGLAEKYPSIRTYLIQDTENPLIHGRMSMTAKGMKAYITSPDESYFIYPDDAEKNTYAVFYNSEYKRQDFNCQVLHEDLQSQDVSERTLTQIGEVIREYRLAVSTTGEYTAYHGGTIVEALAAIVETINQVNVVYENDFSVRFILVDRNDELINLDASKDPFINSNAGQMLSSNADFINGRIGVGSYDMGHVFATSGAGLASLRSVCSDRKAQGATGVFPPEGKAFDIDYVAHEFGHQLGSNHTFNNCGSGQEVENVAFEPGSGSTIMAYAGICGSNNVQFGSDPYFHVSSLIQITDWLEGQGGNCAGQTDSGNNAPIVEAGESGFFIPIGTPFFLDGEVSDPDGDPLTYCWEQYDRGPLSDYGNPRGNAPSFRSLKPTSNLRRYCPKLNSVVDNRYDNSEVLPENSRDFTFQLTARDNKVGGGAAAWDIMSFKATDEAGPFVVTSQNEDDIIWESNRQATVTWDVANTDKAPVNCSKVNIVMSKNLGFSFDILLAENVDNDGSASFIVPDAAISNFARVQVVAANNIFYNVNAEEFKVVQGVVSTQDAAFEHAIDIFPNPSDGEFTIQLGSTLHPNAKVEILDMQGKLLDQHQLNSQQQTINLAVPTGLYFLKITQDQKVAYKKVVLTK